MSRTKLALIALSLPVVALTGCSADDSPAGVRRPAAEPATAAEQRIIDHAEGAYTTWVAGQAGALLDRTRTFAEAVRSGDDARARAIYPQARTHWERIETVAESFGDLDPRLDAREADLAEGESWTGWHRLEKDLWPQRADDYTPLTAAERDHLAGLLVDDTEALVGRIRRLHLGAGEIVSGSQGLLEEVATGKITGEEEYWSGTDLYDVQANLDGARVGYEHLRPLVEERDPDLARTLDARFEALQEVLDGYRRGNGFVTYDALSRAQLRELAAAVNALAEPMAGLNALVPA